MDGMVYKDTNTFGQNWLRECPNDPTANPEDCTIPGCCNGSGIENVEVNNKLYNKIINPKTGRYVNINGKIGREILRGFINQSKK